MAVKYAPTLAGVDQCTGCAACFASCGTKAISMVPDDEGFLRPVVDLGKCVGCGVCTSMCPEVNFVSRTVEPQAVYACWDREDERREQATSGGVFMLLADAVLKRGGWVCGAVLDESLSVRHVVTRDRSMVKRMRGSKYVQSDLGSALEDCVDRLRADELVLFTGTPCQIAAVRQIASRVHSGELLVVDMLCHGAPSPLFWRAYLSYREGEMADKVVDARFRKKQPSWTVFS